MFSRIACLIEALAFLPAFADPVAPPPVFVETGHTRILAVDLSKPQPETVLSNVWQVLEAERGAASLAPARRDEIDVAKALIEIQRKNPRKAAALLSSVPEQSVLRDAALYYRAQALRLTGEESTSGPHPTAGLSSCQEARTVLRDLDDLPSGPFTEPAVGEARRATYCYVAALVGLRKYSDARPLIAALLQTPNEFDSKEREFLYASLLTILKREKNLLDARRLYEEAKGSLSQSQTLASLASDLPALPPATSRPSFGFEQPQTVSMEAADEALFRTALKQISRRETKTAVETLVRIQNEYPGSMAARKASSRLRVLATSLLAEATPPSYFLKSIKKLQTEPLYSLGKSIWEDGKDKEAAEIFTYLIDSAPKHPLAGNFYYSLARIQENAGDWKAARTNYEKVVTEHSGNPFFDRSHFKVGWLSYLLQEDEKAKKWLEADRAKTQDTTLIAQDLYWLAKVLERQQKPGDAKKYLSAIRKVAPLSYYTFLSGQLPGTAAAGPLPDLRPRSYGNAVRIGRARSFLAAGLPSAAGMMLREFDLDADPGAWEEIALLSTYAGQNGYAFSLASSLVNLTSDGNLSQRLTDIIFPRPLEPVVRTEAATQAVDPLLVTSLIKQESAFREDAESSAGARGLMQLMPQTARQVARDLKEPSPERASLISAPFNIRYGTFYLAGLLKNYSGNVVLALAAYNAGTQRVDAWYAQWKDQPPDVFVELIPFEETRNYVKSISRNYAFYSKLYANRVIQMTDLFPPPSAK